MGWLSRPTRHRPRRPDPRMHLRRAPSPIRPWPRPAQGRSPGWDRVGSRRLCVRVPSSPCPALPFGPTEAHEETRGLGPARTRGTACHAGERSSGSSLLLELQRRGGSIAVRADDLPPGPGAESPPGLLVDRVLDELYGAVAHADVHAAGMEARGVADLGRVRTAARALIAAGAPAAPLLRVWRDDRDEHGDPGRAPAPALPAAVGEAVGGRAGLPAGPAGVEGGIDERRVRERLGQLRAGRV